MILASVAVKNTALPRLFSITGSSVHTNYLKPILEDSDELTKKIHRDQVDGDCFMLNGVRRPHHACANSRLR